MNKACTDPSFKGKDKECINQFGGNTCVYDYDLNECFFKDSRNVGDLEINLPQCCDTSVSSDSPASEEVNPLFDDLNIPYCIAQRLKRLDDLEPTPII